MRPPLLRALTGKLIVDSFAGGGGASLGILEALGRGPDIAINHDADAIRMHRTNHPETRHYTNDVWAVDPVTVCEGKPVGLMWLSPDCKHFSKAKGGKPVEKKIRGLAWVAVKWAKAVKPDVICLENVEEFEDWGPLLEDGRPCPVRKGLTFRRFVRALKNSGYVVEYREIVAADHGAPTSRKRLFLVARSDGQRIVWPEPTYGKGMARPWRTAAECIIWSLPCPSIFERVRPLAENTHRRIARGIRKYVIDALEPFIVPVAHAGDDRAHSINEPMRTVTGAHRGEHALVTPFLTEHANASSQRIFSADEPLRTQCGEVKGGHFALVAPCLVGAGGPTYSGKPAPTDAPMGTQTAENHRALVAAHITPFYGIKGNEVRGTSPADPLQTQTGDPRFGLVGATLIQTGYGEREGQAPRVPGIDKPLGTVVGGGKHALVTAFMAQHNGGFYDERGGAGRQMDLPMSTITQAGSNQAVVASSLIKMRGTNVGQPVQEPLQTVSAQGNHFAEVRAFLIAYYGKDKEGQQLELPMRTVTVKDRLGLVTVHGQDYAIVDIGMRMLAPRELYRAQGFPDSYLIDADAEGKPFTKSAQVRMCGNSVCPPVAAAIVRAQFGIEQRRAAA